MQYVLITFTFIISFLIMILLAFNRMLPRICGTANQSQPVIEELRIVIWIVCFVPQFGSCYVLKGIFYFHNLEVTKDN